MLLDDYTKAQSEEPAKSSQQTKISQPFGVVGLVILSAVVGFVGGMLALRINPEIVTVSDSVTESIVIREGEIIADIVDKVAASVVSINVTSEEELFDPFFGGGIQEFEGSGTGIVLTANGLIVTNEHVVPEGTTEVTVILNDGTEYADVGVVGREPFNDIAYLQIKNVEDLVPAVLGDSDEVRVGSQVIAIGNALGEFDATVTSGIISGEGRPIVAGAGRDSELLVNLFQTDASINPGNSGGPLLNLSGEIIGINTAVAGDAENIGFAIPINDVKPGIASIENHGELIRPYLGVRYISLNRTNYIQLNADREVGALIYDDPNGSTDDAIIPDSPADKAGLRNKDIILEVNRVKIDDDNPLPNVVSRYQVGETITLKVLRGGEEIDVDVTLERVPENLS